MQRASQPDRQTGRDCNKKKRCMQKYAKRRYSGGETDRGYTWATSQQPASQPDRQGETATETEYSKYNVYRKERFRRRDRHNYT